MDSEATARVLEMPAVKAERESKAAKAEAKRAAKEKADAETPEVVFSSVSEAAAKAIESWEAAQSAREKRTAIGKRYADQVRTANEKVEAAIADNPKSELGKHLTALGNAKARAAKLRKETEELVNDCPVSRAWKSRARVLDERAEEKATAGKRVTKTGERFEAVMSSIRIQAAQLRLAL